MPFVNLPPPCIPTPAPLRAKKLGTYPVSECSQCLWIGVLLLHGELYVEGPLIFLRDLQHKQYTSQRVTMVTTLGNHGYTSICYC